MCVSVCGEGRSDIDSTSFPPIQLLKPPTPRSHVWWLPGRCYYELPVGEIAAATSSLVIDDFLFTCLHGLWWITIFFILCYSNQPVLCFEFLRVVHYPVAITTTISEMSLFHRRIIIFQTQDRRSSSVGVYYTLSVYNNTLDTPIMSVFLHINSEHKVWSIVVTHPCWCLVNAAAINLIRVCK